MIKIAIVDDHNLLVEGISNTINTSEVAIVVGTAHSIKECRDNIPFWHPDVVLLDVSLPDGNGIDYCKELRSQYNDLKIIALTTHNEYAIIKQMMDNGASGYLLKSASSQEVFHAIQSVYDGQIYLSNAAESILKQPENQNIWLTQREKEVLLFISEGMTNAEIGEQLFISAETVKSYRKNLLLKLDAKNTALLIKKALELKLI